VTSNSEGSAFESILQIFLSSIPILAAENGGFCNGTAGDKADRVYGLMCVMQMLVRLIAMFVFNLWHQVGSNYAQTAKLLKYIMILCLLH
jgi:hypothetical protein